MKKIVSVLCVLAIAISVLTFIPSKSVSAASGTLKFNNKKGTTAFGVTTLDTAWIGSTYTTVKVKNTSNSYIQVKAVSTTRCSISSTSGGTSAGSGWRVIGKNETVTFKIKTSSWNHGVAKFNVKSDISLLDSTYSYEVSMSNGETLYACLP